MAIPSQHSPEQAKNNHAKTSNLATVFMTFYFRAKDAYMHSTIDFFPLLSKSDAH